ncbi:hypothetical protein [Aureispira sp. CCB-E]|uniref:hypothetical protein n=1 Tax=Aureispira sp. CCB-E TaxID=3051121 RepID=UPI0028692E48|nr:hypothetical protein [Aureispira sp. CCB-E]WMX17470.1 hypothetical protein QP953_13900 [Aureispira sp. CCB-E]
MYSIELQQNVFACVQEVTTQGEEAYIALVVAAVAARAEEYHQQGEGLKQLTSRVRYTLKRLVQFGYLSEHQGMKCQNGIPMLYYKSTNKYVMENQGKNSKFQEIAMNQMLLVLGGPKGISNKLFGMLVPNQKKIAEFATKRKQNLIEEGLLDESIEVLVSFNIMAVGDKIRVMELAVSKDKKSEDPKALKMEILKNYSLEQFHKMINELIDAETQKNVKSK